LTQLHRKFTDEQVKELIEKYLRKEVGRKYLQEIFGINKTRFFALVKAYRDNPLAFSIRYVRKGKTRAIPKAVEVNILQELAIEKTLIENKDVPIRSYNYSYIKDRLEREYKQKVSLSTIIAKAKKNDFYFRKPKRTIHDREVLTNYAGELIQHDSSYHLWAPSAQEKWYLITSLDDYSRYILYAQLLKKETSWAHIVALETMILTHGLPFSYYVDSHSIFRFVQGRDSFWRKHHTITDEADPQWKQVLYDCNVKVIYALSPQAKGKIERPYQWLQDRLVRTCVRENVSDIRQAQKILKQEIRRYNFRQIHSTTQEVPYFRLQRALKEGTSLFREFKIRPPYQSVKDIFCLRLDRTVDSYRRVSFKSLILKVNGVTYGDKVNIRIYPMNHLLSELRFWCNDRLVDVQRAKNQDLNLSILEK
jgi:transposase